MPVRTLSRLAVPLCVALLAGCAAKPSAGPCAAQETVMVNDLIFLGTDSPAGQVSEQAWEDFLREAVTPRFPQGLTAWRAAGQWRGNDGSIVKEPSFVLDLVHPDDTVSETAVRELQAEYKTRFQQEATMRVKQSACVSF